MAYGCASTTGVIEAQSGSCLAQAGVHSAEAVIGLQQQQQRPGHPPEHVGDLLCEFGCVLLELPPAILGSRQVQVVHR